MPEIKGGCLCGAVRYTASAEPALVGVCHCRDCQKFTGSAFGFFIGVPRSAFEIQGASKRFTKLGDSGSPIVRRFCPECGSSVVEEPPGRPDLAIINAGTFGRPERGDTHDGDLLRPGATLGAVGWNAALSQDARLTVQSFAI